MLSSNFRRSISTSSAFTCSWIIWAAITSVSNSSSWSKLGLSLCSLRAFISSSNSLIDLFFESKCSCLPIFPKNNSLKPSFSANSSSCFGLFVSCSISKIDNIWAWTSSDNSLIFFLLFSVNLSFGSNCSASFISLIATISAKLSKIWIWPPYNSCSASESLFSRPCNWTTRWFFILDWLFWSPLKPRFIAKFSISFSIESSSAALLLKISSLSFKSLRSFSSKLLANWLFKWINRISVRVSLIAISTLLIASEADSLTSSHPPSLSCWSNIAAASSAAFSNSDSALSPLKDCAKSA